MMANLTIDLTFLIRVIIASIVDTALTRDIAHSADPTFDGYEIILVTQVVQCLSIVTACWGQLKPFLNHLTSDGLRVQGVEGQNTRIKPCPGSYSHDGTIRSGQGNHHELVPAAVWDAGSQSSQAGMIRETREWTMADTGQDQQGN